MGGVCTVVVGFAPDDPVPVLLVGVRDEFAARPWEPPGRHWPDLPVTGGLDLQAGGTWLAVNASAARAACVLNGWGGEGVPASRRRSRGDLPLRAASDGLDAVQKLLSDRGTLERFDPFHLVVAEPSSVTALSWDGDGLTTAALAPGTHLYTNAGHAYPAAAPGPGAPPALAGEPGRRELRGAYFGPRFAAERPSGDPHRRLADAWGGWLRLAAGDGLEVSDPRALIIRRELPDGRVVGSASVDLVSLTASGAVRYDFRGSPGATVPASGDEAGEFAWRTVLP